LLATERCGWHQVPDQACTLLHLVVKQQHLLISRESFSFNSKAVTEQRFGTLALLAGR
jgi:hypothetical protein